MKTCNLTVFSKNQASLHNFLNFLNEKTDLNFNYVKKSFKKKKRKKVITILKSPHVNKKAQEQFEIRLFSNQLRINTAQKFKFLVFVKKIKTYLFPDIKMKVKIFNDQQKCQSLSKKNFNPDNFEIKKNFDRVSQNYKLKKVEQIKKEDYEKYLHNTVKSQILLKIFDIYGKS
jgi:ribosomal protein S10